MKIIVMFAGQGSQYENMGLDLFSLDENKEKVEVANSILGFNVLEAIKNNNNELKQTKYTQGLIALMSMLLFDQLELNDIKIDGILGFSLGEVVALYGAKVFSFEDTLKIIKFRGEQMDIASISIPGKMAAILNTDASLIEKICNDINKVDVVAPVNYNSRKQIVISGSINGVDSAIDALKEEGVKRIIPLNVSGGFHTTLMSDAGKLLEEFVLKMTPNINEIPIYLNSNTKELNYMDVAKELRVQIQNPVLFYQTIEKLEESKHELFIEVGPGSVLSQLVNKNYSNLKAINIETINDLDKLKGGI